VHNTTIKRLFPFNCLLTHKQGPADNVFPVLIPLNPYNNHKFVLFQINYLI